ncbi:DNA adenine methylase [Actinomadura viridis]|uniref:DNA adenine methylase n=1 Tax=Actinomadura viridis TaxID=58110 RepID=UPI0036AF109D
MLRPPFVYYGGKQRTASAIAGLLPEHTHYVEPFAGSLAVLLAKKPSRMETVNDLDGDLMLFWRVLRDRPQELARVCALTPHSRAERDLALAHGPELPELERARRVWVCLTQGRTGTLRRTGWRFDASDDAHTSMPRRMTGYLERLAGVATRLADVSLECRPALEVIAAYGARRRTLLYLDPPYLGTVRERNYRYEMRAEAQHRALAEALHDCAATVVVSGYASDLYDRELFAGWHRRELPAATSQGGAWRDRTEVLWSNRPLRDRATPGAPEPLVPLEPAEEGPGFRYTDPPVGSECNETPADRCAALDCGKVIRQPATGRRRKHCSPACRVRAHRHARAAAVERP